MKKLGLLLAALVLLLAIPSVAVELTPYSLTVADKAWLEVVNSDIVVIIADLQTWHETIRKSDANSDDASEIIKITEMLNEDTSDALARSNKITVSDRLSSIKTEYTNAIGTINMGSAIMVKGLKAPDSGVDSSAGAELIVKEVEPINHVKLILFKENY